MMQFVKSIEERRSHCAQCTIVPVKEEQHSHSAYPNLHITAVINIM